jgi:hypothetical protein
MSFDTLSTSGLLDELKLVAGNYFDCNDGNPILNIGDNSFSSLEAFIRYYSDSSPAIQYKIIQELSKNFHVQSSEKLREAGAKYERDMQLLRDEAQGSISAILEFAEHSGPDALEKLRSVIRRGLITDLFPITQ